MLIYNRHPQSTRRLCNLDEVVTALEERGLTHTYADVPSTACHQLAALAAPRRFTITPHGAHEVNLFATWPNASVIEVMPHLTDIPIYNRLVRRPVWVISERLTQPFKCVHGTCQALPAHYGACTRVRLCVLWRVLPSGASLTSALPLLPLCRTPCAESLRATGHACTPTSRHWAQCWTWASKSAARTDDWRLRVHEYEDTCRVMGRRLCITALLPPAPPRLRTRRRAGPCCWCLPTGCRCPAACSPISAGGGAQRRVSPAPRGASHR